MNFGIDETLMSLLALLALPIFFLAPGYLAASASGLMRFSRQSWIERLLWACALSLPFSLLLAAHPGLPLSPHVTTLCFLGLFLLALFFAYRDQRQANTPAVWDRNATILAIIATALVAYVIFSTVPVLIHGHLYESSVWQDWNVRIQLVNAAIRGGNTPGNPMFAIAGQPPPLRYYFFWYVLCARMHDLVPVSGRAILTASCAGAGISLLAFLLLSVKYLSPCRIRVRSQYISATIAAGILGLDLIAFLVTLLHHRFYSDLQFWLDDRSPGFLHMVIWSPHHVAGLVSCGIGTLLFIRSIDVSQSQRVVHGLVAALCFAASAGTSAFITIVFVFACLALFLDALWSRKWPRVFTIAGAGILAGVLISPFVVHTLLRVPQPAAPERSDYVPATVRKEVLIAPENNKHLLSIGLRYKAQATKVFWSTVFAVDKNITTRPTPKDPNFRKLTWLMRLCRLPIMLGFFVFDFGFFLVILIYQMRKDFLNSAPMSQNSRDLWLLAAGIILPEFLFTSSSLQGNNDFGRHAGFCLRLVLILWSAPVINDFLRRWKHAPTSSRSKALAPIPKFALALAAIGLLGQAGQIFLVRFRFALTDAGLIPRVVVPERVPQIARRFAQMQQAMAAAAQITPGNGIVQGNPNSRLHDVLLLYASNQIAASDDGCDFPFGGDLMACLPMTANLDALYGGTGNPYQGMQGVFLPHSISLEPAQVTSSAFLQVCSKYKINTMVANYTDPVWWDRSSWVWQQKPYFSNDTARVFTCAAQASPAPSTAFYPAEHPST